MYVIGHSLKLCDVKVAADWTLYADVMWTLLGCWLISVLIYILGIVLSQIYRVAPGESKCTISKQNFHACSFISFHAISFPTFWYLPYFLTLSAFSFLITFGCSYYSWWGYLQLFLNGLIFKAFSLFLI